MNSADMLTLTLDRDVFRYVIDATLKKAAPKIPSGERIAFVEQAVNDAIYQQQRVDARRRNANG